MERPTGDRSGPPRPGACQSPGYRTRPPRRAPTETGAVEATGRISFIRLATLLPPLALMALIFELSSQPDLGSGLEWDFALRKIAHMAEFAALASLWNWAIFSWMRELARPRRASRVAAGRVSPGDGERSAEPPRRGSRKRFACSFPRWSFTSITLAAFISMIYAVSDEIHQSTVITRHASPLDVVIDWIGIGLACAAIARFGRRA